MIQIRAWQHIYTNVEEGQSPTSNRGFQTLFYSHDGLSENDISELEDRTAYYAGSTRPTKRQYFRLSDGRCVVAQTVPLPEPDRFGRSGRFFSHRFVFDQTDWEKIGCDPFRIFDISPFISTVKEALTQGDFQSGDIPPRSFELSDNETELPTSANTKNHSGWGLLALQATKFLEERRPLALVGSPEYIWEFLRIAILLVPPSKRLLCAFDTHFYKCDEVRTPVWAAGFSESPPSKFYLLSDLSQLSPSTPFERWWVDCMSKQDIDACRSQWTHILAMEALLQKSPAERAKWRTVAQSASPDLVNQFTRLNQEEITVYVKQILGKAVAPPLIEKLLKPLSPEGQWQIVLRGKVTKEEAAEWVYDLEKNRIKPPSDSELMKAVDNLVQETGHKKLEGLLIFWSRDKRKADWQNMLEEMPIEEYETYIAKFQQSKLNLNLYELLISSKVNVWFDRCLENVPMARLGALVKQLSSFKETDALGPLADWVYGQIQEQIEPPQNQEELKVLDNLAKETGHKELKELIVFWLRDKRKNEWRDMLEEMPSEKYKDYVTKFQKHRKLNSLDLLVPDKVDQWLDLCLQKFPMEKEAEMLIRKLISFKEYESLEHLADRVKMLSGAQRKKLKDISRRYYKSAPNFWNAITDDMEKSSIIESLRNWWDEDVLVSSRKRNRKP